MKERVDEFLSENDFYGKEQIIEFVMQVNSLMEQEKIDKEREEKQDIVEEVESSENKIIEGSGNLMTVESFRQFEKAVQRGLKNVNNLIEHL